MSSEQWSSGSGGSAARNPSIQPNWKEVELGVIAALERKDQKALDEIICNFLSEPLLAYIRRLGVPLDDAFDITQDYLLELMTRRIHDFNPAIARLTTYVYQYAAYFVISKWWRKRPRMRPLRLGVDVNEESLPMRRSGELPASLCEAIDRACGSLDDEERQLVSMRIVQEKSLKEIAQQLQISVKAVSKRWRVICEKIRLRLLNDPDVRILSDPHEG